MYSGSIIKSIIEKLGKDKNIEKILYMCRIQIYIYVYFKYIYIYMLADDWNVENDFFLNHEFGYVNYE